VKRGTLSRGHRTFFEAVATLTGLSFGNRTSHRRERRNNRDRAGHTLSLSCAWSSVSGP